jgi:hypothetical protein
MALPVFGIGATVLPFQRLYSVRIAGLDVLRASPRASRVGCRARATWGINSGTEAKGGELQVAGGGGCVPHNVQFMSKKTYFVLLVLGLTGSGKGNLASHRAKVHQQKTCKLRS